MSRFFSTISHTTEAETKDVAKMEEGNCTRVTYSPQTNLAEAQKMDLQFSAHTVKD